MLFSAPAWAGDVIKERAWFEDVGGQRSLEDVQRQTFVPFTGLLSLGFGAAPVWVRLRIDAHEINDIGPGSAQDLLLLRILPSHIDEIRLFDPLDSRASPRVTGDRHAWSSDEHPSLAYSFLVPRGSSSRYVWLRLETTSSRVLLVDALKFEEARRADLKLELLSAAYLGLLVLFLGSALHMYSISPDTLTAAFALQQLTAVLYATFFLGYMRMLMDDAIAAQWVDKLSILATIAYTICALRYQIHMFKAMNAPDWTIRTLKMALWILSFSVILSAIGYSMFAMILTISMVVFSVLFGAAPAILSRYSMSLHDSGSLLVSREILIAMHLLMAAVVAATVLATLGMVEAPRYAIYFPMLYTALSGLVFLWLMQVRAHRMLSRRGQLEAELQVAHEKLAFKQAAFKDQQIFLEMLTHEIKTPLSAIAMLISKKTPSFEANDNIRLALAEMDSVIDRCVQTGWMEDGSKTFSKTTFDVDAMLQQLIQSKSHITPVRYESPGASPLHSDEQVVRLLLSNLLENAVRYGDAGEAVRVSLRPCAEQGRSGLQIRVENQPGLAGWPDPERIFEKYYRSPNAHRQSGSGLGLYLVAGFVNRLNGSIRYAPTNSSIGFELWLPF